MDLPVHADHHADDLRLAELLPAHVDGLEPRVRGREADALALGIEPLHGGLVLDHDHHDLPRRSLQLLAHEDEVAVHDAVADHRIARHLEGEDFAPRLGQQHGVDAHVVGDVLLREERLTRGHLAHDGNVDGLAPAGRRYLALADEARRLSSFEDAERAALQLAALEVALALERLQVVVDPVGGADAEVLADLADGRRVTLVDDALLDEGKDLFLAFGQRLAPGPVTVRNACALVKFSAPGYTDAAMLRANQAVRIGLRAATRNPELAFGKALIDWIGNALAHAAPLFSLFLVYLLVA